MARKKKKIKLSFQQISVNKGKGLLSGSPTLRKSNVGVIGHHSIKSNVGVIRARIKKKNK